MKRITPLLFILYLIPCIAFSQDMSGTEKDLDIIRKNIKQFSELVMASDYRGIGEAYTADAKIFPSNLDIIEGRDAITKYWTQPEVNSIKYHKINPVEIKIKGDEAYDYGYYEGISVNSEGNESSWKGKYVIIWKKVEDDWKIYLDIWNRIRD